MIFFISVLTAILFILIFEKPLKNNPVIFYVISALLSLATVFMQLKGITPDGFIGKYIYPMFSKAGLATAFFVLVMYAATFKNGSAPIKLLMPMRAQLSIVASILAFGHVFSYSALLSPKSSLFYILSVIMFCIMIPLLITSFTVIRKKMSAITWKKLQRFAYIFYIMIYLHILLLYVRGAIRGDSQSALNILMYSVVFLWYFICRPLKAYSTQNKEFNLDRFRYISLVSVIFISLGLYIYLTDTVKEESTDKIVEATTTSDSSTVKDGTYSATCFGYAGDITVEIKIENGEVTNITLPNYEDENDYKHFSEELIAQLRQNPLADIDTVSGATFSTQAVIDAYNEALKQAGIR